MREGVEEWRGRRDRGGVRWGDDEMRRDQARCLGARAE